MSAQLGNGTVRFGDGTVQSTKTPSNVSAFTNDNNYITNSVASTTYATKANTIHSITGSAQRRFLMNIYSETGVYMSTTGQWNCNCNC